MIHVQRVEIRKAPSLPHDALKSVLVPLDRLGLVDLVGVADAALAPSALCDALTRACPA